MLKYFESLVPQDTFTGELEKAVEAARLHKEWRREYMTLERLIRDSLREGREEGLAKGIAEGRAKGIAEGRAEGRAEARIVFVCRKLAKGKTPEAIAEELDEDLGEVRHICDIAAKYAPEYDAEKILLELLP